MKIVAALTLVASVSAFTGVDRALLQDWEAQHPTDPLPPSQTGPAYCKPCGRQEDQACFKKVESFLKTSNIGEEFCKDFSPTDREPSHVCRAYLTGLCHGASGAHHGGGHPHGHGGLHTPPHGGNGGLLGASTCQKKALSHPFKAIKAGLSRECFTALVNLNTKEYVNGLCAMADQQQGSVYQSYMQSHMLTPPSSKDYVAILDPESKFPKQCAVFDKTCAAGEGTACTVEILFNKEVFPFTPNGVTSSHAICSPDACNNRQDGRALLKLAGKMSQNNQHFIESGTITCGNLTLSMVNRTSR